MPSSTSYGFVTLSSTRSIKALTAVVTRTSTNESLTLLVCEVGIYIECKEGTWGVHCKNSCNKSCPGTCRFDDGLCNNACFGYSDPPRCNKVCGAKAWGLNCTNTCRNECFNSSCDRITGVCDKGCLGYSDPPQCTKDCESGFWGLNCIKECNTCVDSSCNSKTGWCDKGCVGFNDPPYCLMLCPAGSWGVNCTNQCNKSCDKLSCDSKTGICDLAVIKSSENTSRQSNIAIGIATSSALIFVVLCLIVLQAK
uniref:Uncharacterized protein n=1 Tax=Biomphalaria glabrata TaxID=6526 RepID=A0A2C9KR93_BIOGL